MNNKNFLIGGWVFFGLAIFLFLMGLHNIDLAMNMKPNEIDIGFVREPVAMQRLYMSGVAMQVIGILFFFLSNLLILSYFEVVRKE